MSNTKIVKSSKNIARTPKGEKSINNVWYLCVPRKKLQESNYPFEKVFSLWWN